MASSTGSKINRLLKAWPSGTVAVLPWLEKQGVYQQLVHEYEKTSWVRTIGRGAYAKAGDKVGGLAVCMPYKSKWAFPYMRVGKRHLPGCREVPAPGSIAAPSLRAGLVKEQQARLVSLFWTEPHLA
jgi:hypothetical protein